MRIQPIILAAGASTRMSSPKQLLGYKKTTLVRRIAEQLISLSLLPPICVTGFLEKELYDALEGLDIRFVHNIDYHKGMISSIAAAMDEVKANIPCDAVLITLTDQPLIPVIHYQKLIDAAERPGKEIVASYYNNTHGVPALFKSNLFDMLSDLYGRSGGARLLIGDRLTSCTLIPCEEAGKDIDTDQDYQDLLDT